jgi:hypothetical protein
MTVTYSTIQTYTIPSVTTTFTLSSIPSTYTDLVLVFGGGTVAPTGVYIRFNGDSGSNYSTTRMSGWATNNNSARSTNQTRVEVGGSWSDTNHMVVNLQNYSNTSINKVGICRTSDATDTVAAGAILWRNTAAINSIAFSTDATNFAAGTVITLYGIKAE